MIVFISCDVDDLPDTDADPPEFTFTLQGPGLNRTFTPRDNFEELQVNLVAGGDYSFTFFGADAGGVRKVLLQAPAQFLSFSDLAADVDIENNGFAYIISKAGDFNTPTTGLTITGTLNVTGSSGEYPSIYMEVMDFASPANVTSATLQIGIVDNLDEAGF